MAAQCALYPHQLDSYSLERHSVTTKDLQTRTIGDVVARFFSRTICLVVLQSRITRDVPDKVFVVRILAAASSRRPGRGDVGDHTQAAAVVTHSHRPRASGCDCAGAHGDMVDAECHGFLLSSWR